MLARSRCRRFSTLAPPIPSTMRHGRAHPKSPAPHLYRCPVTTSQRCANRSLFFLRHESFWRKPAEFHFHMAGAAATLSAATDRYLIRPRRSTASDRWVASGHGSVESQFRFLNPLARRRYTRPSRPVIGDLLAIVSHLEVKGVSLRVLSISGNQTLDTSTSTGRLMLAVIGAVGQRARGHAGAPSRGHLQSQARRPLQGSCADGSAAGYRGSSGSSRRASRPLRSPAGWGLAGRASVGCWVNRRRWRRETAGEVLRMAGRSLDVWHYPMSLAPGLRSSFGTAITPVWPSRSHSCAFGVSVQQDDHAPRRVGRLH